MQNKITGIVIQTNVRAYRSGIHEETVIFWLREGVETPARYTTDDILERGNISAASVKRAERAQARLVERAQLENDEPSGAARAMPDASVDALAKKLYAESEGNVAWFDCLERAEMELSLAINEAAGAQ